MRLDDRSEAVLIALRAIRDDGSISAGCGQGASFSRLWSNLKHWEADHGGRRLYDTGGKSWSGSRLTKAGKTALFHLEDAERQVKLAERSMEADLKAQEEI